MAYSPARKAATYRWREKYPERYKAHVRKMNLKASHNMTPEDYQVMWDDQAGRCAVCGREETGRNQHGLLPLAVDHDHQTGERRGLLCMRCNRALGMLGDDAIVIRSLLAYVTDGGEVTIYTAGPIEHADDGGSTWRKEAIRLARRGTRIIDPTHYDGAADGLTPSEIVGRDRYLLREADGVIFDARSQSAGWGTAMELLDAYQLGKPVVGWGPPARRSAFLAFHCTKFFDTLPEAMVYMEELLRSARGLSRIGADND